MRFADFVAWWNAAAQRDAATPLPALPAPIVRDPEKLLHALPTLARKLAGARGTPRDYDVLSRYYGLDGHSPQSLQAIGAEFEVSRERARQLRDRMLRRMAKALEGNLNLPGFDVPDRVLPDVAAVKGLMMRGPTVIAEEEIARALAGRGRNPLGPEARLVLPLLLELLGGKQLRGITPGSRGKKGERYWIPRDDVHPARVRALAEGLHRSLRDHPDGKTWGALASELDRGRTRRLPQELLRDVAALMEDVEELEGGRVRLRFGALASQSDRAYRVLAEAGAPLHVTEMARRINLASLEDGEASVVKDPRCLARLLSDDDRLEPIARSGRWKLREWEHVRADSVLDLTMEVLRQTEEPLSYDQVHQYVVARRPDISRTSITSLPCRYPDLVIRPGTGLLALSSWGLQAAAPRQPRKPEHVHAGVRDVLLEMIEDRGTRDLPLAAAVRNIVRRRSISESTVRAKLNREPWAEIVKRDRGLVLRVDVEALEAAGDLVSDIHRSPVRDRVGDAVRESLSLMPKRRAPLRDLRALVRWQLDVQDSTIYWAVKQMPEIGKYRDGRVVMVGLNAEDSTQPAPEAPLMETVDCPERNAPVRLVRGWMLPQTRRKESEDSPGGNLVCLDYGPSCTGEICPLAKAPPSEMERRLHG